MSRLAWATILSLLATAAIAAPPEHADPALAPWFGQLSRPDMGGSCCDLSDCRPVDWRVEGDHDEALLTHETYPGYDGPPVWIAIPEKKIIQKTDDSLPRPAGAVMCWRPYFSGRNFSEGVLCFVRGSGT